ncbi:LysE family translocator [Acinetobacter defluvii]|uniref:LysE family translocator n=1 Tax=Acinetobacter defluvii TaxID=1871111 RepID=UPI003AF63C94
MLSLLFSMFSFSLSMLISPGSINLTILSSSMNYGVKKTFGFISGATIGFTLLLAAVCFGLYQLLAIYPVLLDGICILGTVLLIWIGWNIFKADGEKIQTSGQEKIAMPSFMQGMLMQWLNPKAWIAAVSGTALFSASHNQFYLAVFVLIYFIVCYLSLLIWGIAGQQLAGFLNERHRAKIFNRFMGTVLMGVSLQMCWQHFIAR